MVLHLEVRRFLDLEALDHGVQLFSFRVVVWAQFRRLDGWTSRLPVLIDTGAPFSVLPKSLWTDLQVEDGFPTSLRGLVPLQSASLKAKLAQVTCMVSDRENTSRPLPFWALLADGEVPLVLGCSGFLERARLILDGPHHRASLDV